MQASVAVSGDSKEETRRRQEKLSVAEKVFAEGVAKEIKMYLPPEYESVECHVVEQRKNNDVPMVGICFRMPGESVSPLIYVEPFYNEIRRGRPIPEIMEKIAEMAMNSREISGEMAEICIDNYVSVKDHLNLALVNTKANQKMLSEMPHMEVEDLSAILRVEVPAPGGGTGSIKVTNEILEKWNVGKNEVFDTAIKNMEQNTFPELMDMESIMDEIVYGTPANKNLLNNPGEVNRSPFKTMYVLSNKDRRHGAAVMLSSDVMNRIGEIFPEGVYILPSSVHELLVIPKDNAPTPKELGKMVREVNRTEVAKNEVLSDRVYEYNKEHGKICQVPESIEKQRGMER